MIKVVTYDVALGNGVIDIGGDTLPNEFRSFSFQAEGDGDMDDAVTAQVQESNIVAGTYKDVSGAVATVDENTNEYIDGGDFNGIYLQMEITVGSATLGIMTFTIHFKK